MIKTLIAAAVAGAFALPLVAQASAVGDNIVVAQAGGGDASSSSKQPGANPPGTASPGAPSTSVTGADRATGVAGSSAPNFDSRDRNRDGFISRDEARDASELNTRFTELDLNNDGKLTRQEYEAVNRSATGATADTRSPASTSGAK